MDIIAKIGERVKRHRRDIFFVICLCAIGLIGYVIGNITAPAKEIAAGNLPAVLDEGNSPAEPNAVDSTPLANHTDQRVVASKNSKSKLYHYTWCSGAARIKDTNKIWFDSATAAEAAGYTLAGNCNP